MGLPGWKYNASTAGIFYLQFNLWGSLITTSLAIYLFTSGASDPVLVPCAVLVFIASVATLAYLAFHQQNACKRRGLSLVNDRDSSVRRPIFMAVRLSIALAMLWLISSGWNMIIAARQPICQRKTPMLRPWQAGGTCIAQRAGAAFSIINLLSACAIFTHVAVAKYPFQSHLFGKAKDRPATVTPYRFSAAFRISREKQNRHAHKRSASREAILATKPLPDTPVVELRPLTPTVDPVGLGIGIWSPVQAPMSPLTSIPIPPRSPARLSSSHISSKSPSPYNTRSSLHQHHQNNLVFSNNSASLPGFTPLKEISRPSPAPTSSSAWRAMHPPASEFRHVSSAGPSPSLQRSAAQNLAAIKTMPASPLVDLSASRSPTIRSGSAYPYARGHVRNKSAPFTDISLQSPQTQPESLHTTPTISSPRRKGHVRCTSDPNEMISAHLAAEMDVAMRLDEKLREVSQKVAAQRAVGHQATPSQTTAISSFGPGTVSSASEAGEGSTVGTELSWPSGTSTSGAVRKAKSSGDLEGSALLQRQRIASALFAKMEWEMLMGKEVSVLE